LGPKNAKTKPSPLNPNKVHEDSEAKLAGKCCATQVKVTQDNKVTTVTVVVVLVVVVVAVVVVVVVIAVVAGCCCGCCCCCGRCQAKTSIWTQLLTSAAAYTLIPKK
jgi:hypothetical protein